MATNRMKRELIKNESKRNATFEKKRERLVKKADELSVLCGVEVAIVIHKQRHHNLGGEDNAVLWPSPPIFRDKLHKFLDYTDYDRRRKTVTHEKYMDQIIKDQRESVSRSERRCELHESRQLMDELMKKDQVDDYFHQLGMHQLDRLNSLALDMLTKLETTESSHAPTNVLEDLRNEQWFIDALSEDQDFTDENSEAPPPPDVGGATSASAGGANVPDL